MKDFFGGSKFIFIVIFLAILWVFWGKIISTPQRPVIPPATVTLSPSPSPPASQTASSPSNGTPTPVNVTAFAPPPPTPTPADDEAFTSPKPLTDPFCLEGKRDFVILPSLFLKEFFSKSDSWVALPQSYAKCFKEGAIQDMVFFEFESSYQAPWEPLVKMSARVLGVHPFPSYKELKKTTENYKYALKTGHKPQTSLYPLLETSFQMKLAEPWVQIELHRTDIQPVPTYWPASPTIHPFATVISLDRFHEIMKKNPDEYDIIDTRPKALQEKFKLPFNATHVRKTPTGFHKVILEPGKVVNARLKGLRKKESVSGYILIGRDKFDPSPYNAANLLTLYGHRSLFILDGGAVSLGGPLRETPETIGQAINPEDLHKLRKSAKDTLMVVDCRNPAASSGEIPGAFRLSEKPSTASEPDAKEEVFAENIDVTELSKELAQKKITQVALFGSTRMDVRPSKVYHLLNNPSLTYYQLLDGFQAWSFYSKYKWNDPVARLHPPLRDRRLHQPVRLKVENPLPHVKSIPAEGVVKPGTYTHPTPIKAKSPTK